MATLSRCAPPARPATRPSRAPPPRHAATARSPARAQYVNPHRSDAEELIARVPVIKVKGLIATCNGGGGALGHPIERAAARDARSGRGGPDATSEKAPGRIGGERLRESVLRSVRGPRRCCGRGRVRGRGVS